MARKFDLISELYERTCFAVTDNPVNWQSFLKTAGRNFRLRFDEQLLIYTAVFSLLILYHPPCLIQYSIKKLKTHHY